ncbi:helix-turn-helix transcriptional regulator [Mycobacterium sp. KBS0706]|uniref:helix-turn-helix domain-containing protein n=1 Tax=Mycobacterium sp. KBS0706 TaxID=2578109 RepID=UPI00110FE32E|nr:helix-turn-helix transcriptional regulator [Mycobacterium sp. KBS0706]TSD85260.1 helix-turn-helix transcriptional regulator [Mycobacterium sp. KBS0706]
MPRGRTERKPDPVDVAVGWNIRQRRQQAGVSLERVAGRLELSFQQLQKYETGASRISAAMLVRIAQVLEVPAAQLLAGVADGANGGISPDEVEERQAALALARDLLAIPDPTVRRSLQLHLRALARAGRETPSGA